MKQMNNLYQNTKWGGGARNNRNNRLLKSSVKFPFTFFHKKTKQNQIKCGIKQLYSSI